MKTSGIIETSQDHFGFVFFDIFLIRNLSSSPALSRDFRFVLEGSCTQVEEVGKQRSLHPSYPASMPNNQLPDFSTTFHGGFGCYYEVLTRMGMESEW